MKLFLSTLIFYFICIGIVFSQKYVLVGFNNYPDYSKNCEIINKCIDSLRISGDTLVVEIIDRISSFSDPELKESFNFKSDTVYFDYAASPRIIDTIIKYNSSTFKYDTLLEVSMTIGATNDFCSRLIYKILGFDRIPKNIKYQNKIITECP